MIYLWCLPSLFHYIKHVCNNFEIFEEKSLFGHALIKFIN